jgi:predicted Rossmann-fold nucleotide-binding protein
MATITKGVSVFGSARTPKRMKLRSSARNRQIARRSGFEVITGGGPGVMEAANRGAFEAKKVSVGCNIELPFEQSPNPYQTHF